MDERVLRGVVIVLGFIWRLFLIVMERAWDDVSL